MAKFKQYKISDLIKRLEEQKAENGDLLVEMSIDEEGNAYHPLGDYVTEKEGGKTEVMIPFEIGDGKIIFYPCE